jgi:hypothetical protein
MGTPKLPVLDRPDAERSPPPPITEEAGAFRPLKRAPI